MPAPSHPLPSSGQLVTLTVNRSGPGQVRASMRRMATDHAHLRGLPGLKFYRLLGTGQGARLSLGSDLSRWARAAVWQSRAAFDLFEDSPWRRQEGEMMAESATLLLRPLRWHGRWGGQEPFGPQVPPLPSSGQRPLAVLTRAVIRPGKLAAFWRAVPDTQAFLPDQPGLLSALGLGEWPLVQQATFSVWQDQDRMKAYAHHGAHRQVIARTRQEDWYSEELFARFEVLEVQGVWAGLPSGPLGLATRPA